MRRDRAARRRDPPRPADAGRRRRRVGRRPAGTAGAASRSRWGRRAARRSPWSLAVAAPAVDGAARRRLLRAAAAWLVVAAAVGGTALLRDAEVAARPGGGAGAEPGGRCRREVVVTSDPRPVSGQYGDRVMLRGSGARGSTRAGAASRLRRAGAGDRRRRLARACGWAARCGLRARLAPSRRPRPGRGADRARAAGDGGRAAVWWRGAGGGARVDPRRRSPGGTAAERGAGAGAGRRRRRRPSPEQLADGLPHHRADPPAGGLGHQPHAGRRVPAAWSARWCGVRGRWLYAASAALGIVGFVLLARTEPSVLRAAAMGTVALLGTGRQRPRPRRRVPSAWRSLALLLRRPVAGGLGRLRAVGARHRRASCCSRPPWRDALGRWLPRWVAEAVAVPVGRAAGLHAGGGRDLGPGQPGRGASPTCSPRRLVGPATVLGLPGGLRRPGLAVRWAGWSGRRRPGASAWIVAVARHGAALPTAGASTGGPGPLALLVLRLVCVGLALVLRAACWRRRSTGPACCLLLGGRGAGAAADARAGRRDGLGAGGLRRGPGRRAGAATPGPAAAVVVDAGPDPALVDRCLRPARRASRCRCWCSPTSTPTTSTACRACSTAVGSGRSR